MIGIGLVALTFLGGGAFFIFALVKAINRKSPGWIIATVAAGLVALVGLVGSLGLVAQNFAKGIKTARAKADKPKRITAKNGAYRIDVPGSWREMPELNTDAGIIAGSAVRGQYLLIIENPKSDFAGDLDDFDQLLLDSLTDKLSGMEVSGQEVRKVAGYPARHSRIVGTIENVRLVYHTTSVETKDGFYQILAWTSPSRETDALPTFEEALASFHAASGPPEAGMVKPRQKLPGDTRARVAAITAELLGIPAAKIKPQDRFVEDLGADSLDTVELVMAMEEEFDLSIPDEQAEAMKTVADLATWLDAQVEKPE